MNVQEKRSTINKLTSAKKSGDHKKALVQKQLLAFVLHCHADRHIWNIIFLRICGPFTPAQLISCNRLQEFHFLLLQTSSSHYFYSFMCTISSPIAVQLHPTNCNPTWVYILCQTLYAIKLLVGH